MDSLSSKLFINNEYVSGRSNNLPLRFESPPDMPRCTRDIENAGKEDVDTAVQYAKKAFKGPWKKTFTVHQRRYVLCKFADLLEQHLDELVEISRTSLGNAIAGLAATEIKSAAEIWRFYGKCAEKKSGDSLSTDDGFLKVTWNEPLGITAGIISWNAPLIALATKAAPALITGNTFILKPSEKSPFAVLALGHLIKEAGFPPGVFQILTGDSNTGALLASHPKINVVSFTGSAATGKKVKQLAAKSNSKRVILDLGGKTPRKAIDTDDKNFRQISRSMSEGSVLHQKRVASISLSEDNVEHHSDSEDLDQSIPPLSPTIFTTDRSDSDLYRHEILGPVAVINAFDSESEAVFRVNASSYGLMAGVFTQDVDRALRVSTALESDMVGVNCASKTFSVTPNSTTFPQLTSGGEVGDHTLNTYTEPKTAFVSMNI